MSKKSFILHIDSLSILDDLTDEQAGKLFRAIQSYQKGEEIELDQLTKIAFSPFKNQFVRDNIAYEETAERNRINGLKGGRPKKQQEPKETEKTQVVILKPKKADSDSKSDNDSDSKKVNKKGNLDFTLWPSMPNDQIFNDWMDMRKRLKAPVSQTVVNTIGKQLAIATDKGFTVDDCISECVTRNWKGFKAEWITRDAPESVKQRKML